jgi:hypothetical protein
MDEQKPSPVNLGRLTCSCGAQWDERRRQFLCGRSAVAPCVSATEAALLFLGRSKDKKGVSNAINNANAIDFRRLPI